MTGAPDEDPYAASLALGADGLLAQFNEAGVLVSSDVHVARHIGRLSGVTDAGVQLAVALAARAPRLGHVCVDLRSVGRTASSESEGELDIDALPWPDPELWLADLSASPLVGEGRPLHLHDADLYLDRLWLDELAVARDLLSRAAAEGPVVDESLLASGVAALFADGAEGDPEHLQPIAAALSVFRRLSVIAGGPGTGKTTTVARVLALLDAQAAAAGASPPLVALAAPTGKAAARLEEAVRAETENLHIDEAARTRLRALRGTTIHRLLGFNPGSRTRFRHNAENRLRHDVVVVDETSMVALPMMARLLEAVRPEAGLILVGDPEQLASVEAGAVLGDIVGPASRGLQNTERTKKFAEVVGHRLPEPAEDGGESAPAFGDGVVVLRHVHRYGGGIAKLARATQRGDADGAVEVLRTGGSNVEWLEEQSDASSLEELEDIRALAVASGRRAIEAANAGAAEHALAALGEFRLLCAHRHGPYGVDVWTRHIETWLRQQVEGFTTGPDWYVGRPLIVTENDYSLQLFNGDVGVVVKGKDRPMVAAFERGGALVTVSPMRLAAVDTVYAMTVHKSQGSQFDVVAFVVPGAGSRILTRELFYTAVTRARERLIVVGSEDAVRAAVERPISRASGLRHALWGDR